MQSNPEANMHFRLTPFIAEPEPSARPALTLIIVFIAAAALAAASGQLLLQVLS